MLLNLSVDWGLKLEGVKSLLNMNSLLRKLMYVENCADTCQAATEGRQTCSSTLRRDPVAIVQEAGWAWDQRG